MRLVRHHVLHPDVVAFGHGPGERPLDGGELSSGDACVCLGPDELPRHRLEGGVVEGEEGGPRFVGVAGRLTERAEPDKGKRSTQAQRHDTRLIGLAAPRLRGAAQSRDSATDHREAMSSSSRVSIVIPTFNKVELTMQCLMNLRETAPEAEV